MFFSFSHSSGSFLITVSCRAKVRAWHLQFRVCVHFIYVSGNTGTLLIISSIAFTCSAVSSFANCWVIVVLPMVICAGGGILPEIL